MLELMLSGFINDLFSNDSKPLILASEFELKLYVT